MVEIWHAADATKSNVIMIYWTPEAITQSYVGTDAEFQKVLLPTSTQTCFESRVRADERCSDDWKTRVGVPEGACDEYPYLINKVISKGLLQATKDPAIPAAIQSPAYDMLKVISLSALQIDELFDYKNKYPTPREAVCHWVFDNLDALQDYIPSTFPRVLHEGDDDTTNPLMYVSTTFAVVVIMGVLLTMAMVIKRRHTRVIVFAQVEFLLILLGGLFLVSVGALITSLDPTDKTCIVSVWLVNTGYTVELVPLVVKVAAINRLQAAARRMRRVTLKRIILLQRVALVFSFVVVFLSVWTALDPPRRDTEYILTLDETEHGDTVVQVSFFCEANSPVWEYVALAWNILLLLIATVLAFQSRNIRQSFNESQTLAFMIYSHFFFVVLRVVTFLLSHSSVNELALRRFRSIIYSLDVFATIIIYFVSKLTIQENNRGMSLRSRLGFSRSLDVQMDSAESRSAGISRPFGREENGNAKHQSQEPLEQSDMGNSNMSNSMGCPRARPTKDDKQEECEATLQPRRSPDDGTDKEE